MRWLLQKFCRHSWYLLGDPRKPRTWKCAKCEKIQENSVGFPPLVTRKLSPAQETVLAEVVDQSWI